MARYLVRPCSRCKGYVGIVLREPGRNTSRENKHLPAMWISRSTLVFTLPVCGAKQIEMSKTPDQLALWRRTYEELHESVVKSREQFMAWSEEVALVEAKIKPRSFGVACLKSNKRRLRPR